MISFPPIVARIAIGLGIVALLYAGVSWYGHRRYQAGVEATDAKWAEASARMQAQVVEAQTRAEAAASVREVENVKTIEGLKDEAATKGTATPVGPGVSGVLAKLRADQARRRAD